MLQHSHGVTCQTKQGTPTASSLSAYPMKHLLPSEHLGPAVGRTFFRKIYLRMAWGTISGHDSPNLRPCTTTSISHHPCDALPFPFPTLAEEKAHWVPFHKHLAPSLSQCPVFLPRNLTAYIQGAYNQPSLQQQWAEKAYCPQSMLWAL